MTSIQWQKLEALVLFAGSLVAYNMNGQAWWMYIALLLVPDVFMLGYAIDRRVGAFSYNFGHSLIGPVVLTLLGIREQNSTVTSLGIIWFGHVGFDRMQGYGLKEETSFKNTHLGRIGKEKPKHRERRKVSKD